MVDSRSVREERRYILGGSFTSERQQEKRNEKEERRLKKANGRTANTHMMGGLYQ